jgi:hypothetical protein
LATGNAVFTPKKQPRSKNRGLYLSKESQKFNQFRQLGVLGVLLEALDQQDGEDAVHFILLLTLFFGDFRHFLSSAPILTIFY